jgi:hypothetical protein
LQGLMARYQAAAGLRHLPATAFARAGTFN